MLPPSLKLGILSLMRQEVTLVARSWGSKSHWISW